MNAARREFLKVTAAVGGGLALEMSVPAAALAQGAAKGAEVTAWVVVQPNNDVVIRVARSEMGQGSLTGLPMLVCEELECDWTKVRPEYASVNEHVRRNRVWGSFGTGGSRSIRDSNAFLRTAGAQARTMLVAAAAQRLNVPAGELVAANSVITHTPSGRKVTFGEVAEAASKLPVPDAKSIKLKDPKDWKLLGKVSPQRFEIPDIVSGKAVFGIDVEVPGMVHASIAQCPVFGGRVRSIDAKAAQSMRGVVMVVQLPEAVAVVADNWWRANQALKAVKIDWDTAGNTKWNDDSIKAFLKAGLDAPNLPVSRNNGDADKAVAGAAKTLEAEYWTPYLHHATMEPMSCTARVQGDRIDVWAPTQNAEASMAAAAEAAGVPLTNVEVHKTLLGGGFGRRGAFQDYVRQTVTIAKAVGKPVKLVWSREEDMQHGWYRPVAMVRMKAGLDANGNIVGMHVKSAYHSILQFVRPEDIKNGIDPHGGTSFVDSPYEIPNMRVEQAIRNTHVPTGFWRAVAHSQYPYFRECFLDELAKAAGKDPYQFRRAMLTRTDNANVRRHLGILDAVAKAAGWGNPLPAGVHRGIAISDGYGSYAAAVVEASVSNTGVLDIKRVVVATDPGHVAFVDGATQQVESNVIYGLTAALYGENKVKDGRVVESNFHDYRMMLIKETPKIEVVLAPSGGFWGGMGEPPLMPIAPALCNAIFAATGRPVRSLPLKNLDLRRA
jgi:isoquinoline 1-oxidoreductase beta subunit